jgi:hypothetical protein
MRRVLFGLAALAALALTPATAQAACQIGDCWGAVAYGPGGAWAYAVNMPTRGSAARAAQGRCLGTCSNVLTFHNSCGAYAAGPNGYGWGNAMTRGAAEALAMQQCVARTPGCGIRVWGCTQR